MKIEDILIKEDHQNINLHKVKCNWVRGFRSKRNPRFNTGMDITGIAAF